MKFNLFGFSQQGLMNLGLDSTDALLLRYFIDFKATNKMVTEVVNGLTYFWVKYDAILKEFPILNIKKSTIQARFFKLRDAGVLTHYVKKSGGTYSFFDIGVNYATLLENDQAISEVTEEPVVSPSSVEISKPMDKEEDACIYEVSDDIEADKPETPSVISIINKTSSTLNPSSLKGDPVHRNYYGVHPDAQGYHFKVTTNNPSTKDPSTIYNTPSPSKKAGFGNFVESLQEIISNAKKSSGEKSKGRYLR